MSRLISSGLLIVILASCSALKVSEIYVADGWAKNSINTTIFRNYAIYSHGDHQFIAFYDANGFMTLAKRNRRSDKWEIHKTPHQGNTKDAHNGISIIVDQEGYLHVSWDHHNSPLKYARGTEPLSLHLDEPTPMTAINETVVSYPQFYKLNDGILFFYRSGGSGNGDLFINKYDISNHQWSRLQSNLISGENQRNAYWQACTDDKQTIHISWVWRESPDVASNHDMCYARSEDGGKTWTKSDGSLYSLPITAQNAETIAQIPQKSELINQTSMTTDYRGNPLITSYWTPKDSSIPQFHLITNLSDSWATYNLNIRKTPFSLSGMGTKAIPISRPQIVADDLNVHIIYRDAERSSKISVASAKCSSLTKWEVTDLTTASYEYWEPTLDPVVWKEQNELQLFLQDVSQIDGEGLAEVAPKPVKVLIWKPKK